MWQCSCTLAQMALFTRSRFSCLALSTNSVSTSAVPHAPRANVACRLQGHPRELADRSGIRGSLHRDLCRRLHCGPLRLPRVPDDVSTIKSICIRTLADVGSQVVSLRRCRGLYHPHRVEERRTVVRCGVPRRMRNLPHDPEHHRMGLEQRRGFIQTQCFSRHGHQFR